MKRLAQLGRSLVDLFPERHLYVRSGGAMKAFVLTTRKQLIIAGGVAGGAMWMGVCTAAMLVNLMSASTADRDIAKLKAQSERYVADRQARLDSAMARLDAASGSNANAATSIEKRHAALALLLTDMKGSPGASAALTPAINRALAGHDVNPVRRVEMVRIGQEQLLDAADNFAKGRADRLRLAFRMAGLSPTAFVDASSSIGGPLIESKDPRALAAVLDVDDDFAVRIQRAALDLSEAKALAQAAEDLPLARPTTNSQQTSGFGVRFDPFTRRPAYHSGQDFGGGYATPIYATGPGVISYTGQRSGYGNVVEIDHGRGLKTRYAHLSGFAVERGQRVAVGQRIASMGSTGRSTGTHLHYEVWVNGRAQNPSRFLKAGQYVLQAAD
ncbi:MAG: M23 family metallopeptidase [Alphaproteobacteria bacterium]|nr:M23 family metallopeptidase [Alphaproteobacteria bacterium]MBU1513521.1 M23 family metallopeptidase [Alphaproteobacteria bacterium]MBU2151091.1 M23 family metallopeptidase [Alphaproteobacteria bacterium]MBU2309374.1 M23 family metallopeptidase [Alphaproteobacteria bacterium]MBU2363020.1 M23 family metallopeptidase [Alphaproteobacteria bacterium]